MWCRSRRFDCLLLVFIRRWEQLLGSRSPSTQGKNGDRNRPVALDRRDTNGNAWAVDRIAWWRLAVSSRNVAIYISSDYIVRRTIKQFINSMLVLWGNMLQTRSEFYLRHLKGLANLWRSGNLTFQRVANPSKASSCNSHFEFCFAIRLPTSEVGKFLITFSPLLRDVLTIIYCINCILWTCGWESFSAMERAKLVTFCICERNFEKYLMGLLTDTKHRVRLATKYAFTRIWQIFTA